MERIPEEARRERKMAHLEVGRGVAVATILRTTASDGDHDPSPGCGCPRHDLATGSRRYVQWSIAQFSRFWSAHLCLISLPSFNSSSTMKLDSETAPLKRLILLASAHDPLNCSATPNASISFALGHRELHAAWRTAELGDFDAGARGEEGQEPPHGPSPPPARP